MTASILPISEESIQRTIQVPKTLSKPFVVGGNVPKGLDDADEENNNAPWVLRVSDSGRRGNDGDKKKFGDDKIGGAPLRERQNNANVDNVTSTRRLASSQAPQPSMCDRAREGSTIGGVVGTLLGMATGAVIGFVAQKNNNDGQAGSDELVLPSADGTDSSVSAQVSNGMITGAMAGMFIGMAIGASIATSYPSLGFGNMARAARERHQSLASVMSL